MGDLHAQGMLNPSVICASCELFPISLFLKTLYPFRCRTSSRATMSMATTTTPPHATTTVTKTCTRILSFLPPAIYHQSLHHPSVSASIYPGCWILTLYRSQHKTPQFPSKIHIFMHSFISFPLLKYIYPCIHSFHTHELKLHFVFVISVFSPTPITDKEGLGTRH